MSIYSRDKCTPEELKEFKKKVCDYLVVNGIDLKKIKMRCQRNYDGNVKIYTYKQEFENRRKSIRKDIESPTGYSRAKYSQEIWMGIFFYRAEWEDYLKSDPTEQRKWDLGEIKKLILLGEKT